MGVLNGHEYVEIGGVKWATMNLGATTSAQTGLYFQWGDTAGYTSGQCGSNSTNYKKPFGWGNYKFSNGASDSPMRSGVTKYNSSDEFTVLEECDDAARLNWGCGWRMPTTDEFTALGEATTSAWTQVNGVSGMMLTDKTDSTKTLFFPAAGYCGSGSFHDGGTEGNYWSSSLRSSDVLLARFLWFTNNNVSWNSARNRPEGCSVRGVVGE